MNSDLSFRKLELRDVYTFKNWGKHSSILLIDYNFCENSKKELREWYNWKNSRLLSKIYVILYKKNPIGYIDFRKINPITKTATLGIALDPNYTDKNFGTNSLYFMLKYFLFDKNFNKIYLKVADFNKRALHIYEKLGFIKIRKTLMPFYNGNFDENNLDFVNNRNSFKIILGKTFFYAHKMVVTKETLKEV